MRVDVNRGAVHQEDVSYADGWVHRTIPLDDVADEVAEITVLGVATGWACEWLAIESLYVSGESGPQAVPGVVRVFADDVEVGEVDASSLLPALDKAAGCCWRCSL